MCPAQLGLAEEEGGLPPPGPAQQRGLAAGGQRKGEEGAARLVGEGLIRIGSLAAEPPSFPRSLPLPPKQTIGKGRVN